MSTKTASVETPEQEAAPHVSNMMYIKVALLLAVLTAIEISVSYISALEGTAERVLLLILSATKFTLVALYFMHLKYEAPFLRRVFVAGIAFAIVFFTAYLLTLHAFS